MSGSSKIRRIEPPNSPSGNSPNEIKNGDSGIPTENQVPGGEGFPSGPQSPLGDSASQDASSQKMYWNAVNSTAGSVLEYVVITLFDVPQFVLGGCASSRCQLPPTLCGGGGDAVFTPNSSLQIIADFANLILLPHLLYFYFSTSINPQSSVVKAESWTTPTSGSSTVGSSSVNPASNGPPALRPYMSSTAGTPNSGSHHATYTPCSSNSSGMYEGATLPLPKREMVSLTSSTSNDNGGAYLAPTTGPEYAYPQPNTSDSSIDSQAVPMWSGPSAPSSRPQGADYYSSSSQNSMKGGGGSVRFDNRMDTTSYPLPQENLPPVEENKEEMVEEILELEGYSDGGDDEAEDYVDFGNNIKVPTVSDSFEGINFPQLFAASNDHSEKIIDLARQFYCKFGELLEEGGRVGGERQGNGYSSFTLDNVDSVLGILTSMLEECLFHMVDWVNRTEIFRIIRVEDKMQLLNSSWSEVIIVELLQCLILNLQEKTRVGAVTPTEPSNMDLYRLVITLMNYLLPGDDNQRMMGLIKRFIELNPSSHEFTCLKFLAIFNCLKHGESLSSFRFDDSLFLEQVISFFRNSLHLVGRLFTDVHLTQPSLRYVQQVQGELCHFLLRAARRTFRKGGHIPHLPDYLSFTNLATPAMLTTIAASERLSLLLSRLTEVKHVAFQLESFLVGRYYAFCIPNESLLTEMLLTKRGARNRVPSMPQQPPSAPPAPIGGFEYNYSTPPPSQTVPMKRDPNVYTSSVTTSDWRPQSAGGNGGDGYRASTPAQYFSCTTPHPAAAAPPSADFSNSQAPSQPPNQAQDQSFFMPPQNGESEGKSLTAKLFKLVSKGRLKRLQRLVNQSFASDDGSTSISSSTATVYLLASAVDSRGRRLLHVACEHGHLEMVRYLVDLGLPTETCDRKGNTPAHSCIKYGLKSKRFEKCCKLLACLIESNLELLYVRNNEGTSSSYLLEQLWQESAPEERTKGDATDTNVGSDVPLDGEKGYEI
ncbi:unnamed protein product [Hymenolepis diminuta]|uniref:NR LBD domain-containing protein n=1 Tax=Hymenolepis diminuta TaxID=6216 RepID=A0A158QG83_HYMDI|nr:unnamed protein product [Hymenolepis diminuta]